MSGALEWRDVTNARDEDGLLIAVRRGKTNPAGETADVTLRQGRRLQGPGARQHARRHLARVNANAGNLPRSASSRSWPIGPARLRLHAALHVRPVGYSRSGEAVRTAGSRPGGSRTGPDRQVPRSWREGEAELTDRPLWDAEPQRAPAMVLALERVGWSNAAFWMRRQAQYDLAQERLRQEQAVA